jgi:hypothetical protein
VNGRSEDLRYRPQWGGSALPIHRPKNSRAAASHESASIAAGRPVPLA